MAVRKETGPLADDPEYINVEAKRRGGPGNGEKDRKNPENMGNAGNKTMWESERKSRASWDSERTLRGG